AWALAPLRARAGLCRGKRADFGLGARLPDVPQPSDADPRRAGCAGVSRRAGEELAEVGEREGLLADSGGDRRIDDAPAPDVDAAGQLGALAHRFERALARDLERVGQA